MANRKIGGGFARRGTAGPTAAYTPSNGSGAARFMRRPWPSRPAHRPASSHRAPARPVRPVTRPPALSQSRSARPVRPVTRPPALSQSRSARPVRPVTRPPALSQSRSARPVRLVTRPPALSQSRSARPVRHRPRPNIVGDGASVDRHGAIGGGTAIHRPHRTSPVHRGGTTPSTRQSPVDPTSNRGSCRPSTPHHHIDGACQSVTHHPHPHPHRAGQRRATSIGLSHSPSSGPTTPSHRAAPSPSSASISIIIPPTGRPSTITPSINTIHYQSLATIDIYTSSITNYS